MNDFDMTRLRRIHDMGFTHIWYTGVIRHATTTDYSEYGIPRQHPSIVKGLAGSPYAITDYYDIDPDIATDVDNRMAEFEQLIDRTHKMGMKVLIDFVPNHVARQYNSICRPKGVEDLGEVDDVNKHFSPQNNFYYCPGQRFISPVEMGENIPPYEEIPAKCTGNDRFDHTPGINDWYETIKLNYGIDYCNMGGRSEHFDPLPSTWTKMTDILLYWVSKGVDGFRCDMAEMVPWQFWSHAIETVKARTPIVVFIGEVYDTGRYRTYINAGFDYLYDKVGMYDCLRDVICNRRPASSITYYWQQVDDIKEKMLFFLENHDEQRIASEQFCNDARKAIPGMIVLSLMLRNPIMVYSGQEFGEKAMDEEGFSGRDGRTTIFDYWYIDKIYRGYFDRRRLDRNDKALQLKYQQILRMANREKAVYKGDFFDLMYVNPQTWKFNPRYQYAFLRKYEDEVLLIVANFSQERIYTGINIPEHAFEMLGIPETEVTAVDLLSGETLSVTLVKNCTVNMDLQPYSGRVYKFSIQMEKNNYILTDDSKADFPPAHTAMHLLNAVMSKMLGCEHSFEANIERKKSKMSFVLNGKPGRNQEKEIEQRMNELIEADLSISYEDVDKYNLPEGISLKQLPENSAQMIRLVRIGDIVLFPCAGRHVRSTSQIGRFELLGTNWDQKNMTYKIRFKVIPS